MVVPNFGHNHKSRITATGYVERQIDNDGEGHGRQTVTAQTTAIIILSNFSHCCKFTVFYCVLEVRQNEQQ
jgi:hypothetical protein